LIFLSFWLSFPACGLQPEERAKKSKFLEGGRNRIPVVDDCQVKKFSH
jgi:hypothetical protein